MSKNGDTCKLSVTPVRRTVLYSNTAVCGSLINLIFFEYQRLIQKGYILMLLCPYTISITYCVIPKCKVGCFHNSHQSEELGMHIN